jgi:transcriptional regulator with XRE-family HTH domain
MKSDLLKAERIKRGWTQAKVAEAVGVDAKTVGRWERGKGVPYPYFRQQLCTLFGKTAEQLGLLAVDQDTAVEGGASLGIQWTAPESAIPASFLADPSIPLSLQGATSLVGRHGLLMEIKERLLAGEDIAVTAVDSLPGIGKTALATVLVMDQEVRDHFCDGILWAGLGPRPNVLGHLMRWGMLLGLVPSQVDNIGSREDWERALRAAIGTRRLLLIIDDACTVEDALSLQVGGEACVHLLTTRRPQVASIFAQEKSIFVPQLTETESLVLLASFVPELVKQDLQGAQALVQAVGGSPLALTLMGKYLDFTKQPWPLHNSLVESYDSKKDLEGSIPTLSGQFSASLAQSTPVNLHTIIALCDQSLSPQAHAALCALAVFPPQPKSFSQEAALAASQQSEETLDMLLAVGLLETCGPGRYSWHQAVAEYARAQRDALATSRHLATSVMRDAQESEPNRPLPALSWAQSLPNRPLPALSWAQSLPNRPLPALSWAQSFRKSSPSPVESASTLRSFKHLFLRPWLTLSMSLLTILVIGVIVLACVKQLYLGRTLPASNSGATSIATNANPYPPYSDKLVLDDPLSNNNRGNGWQETSSHRFNDGMACQFIGGAYHVINEYPGSFLSCHASLFSSNLAFEAQMRIIKGNCGGLVVRDTRNQAHAYSFQVCQDGFYIFHRFDGFSSGQTLQTAFSLAIVTGLNQSNVITTIANGSTFDLYINHHKVATMHDSSYSQGQFGVTASANTEVVYTHAKMWIW